MLKARDLRDFLRFFPVVKRVSVQWGEQDLFQHVNNTVYFKYQEASRLKFLGFLIDNIDKSYDKEGFHKGTSVGPILADTYCKFKFPLKYPDHVLIGSTILEGGMQKDRYTLSHSIWSMNNNRIVAEGSGTVVNFNYKLNRPEEFQKEMLDVINLVMKRDSLHLYDDIMKRSDD